MKKLTKRILSLGLTLCLLMVYPVMASNANNPLTDFIKHNYVNNLSDYYNSTFTFDLEFYSDNDDYTCNLRGNVKFDLPNNQIALVFLSTLDGENLDGSVYLDQDNLYVTTSQDDIYYRLVSSETSPDQSLGLSEFFDILESLPENTWTSENTQYLNSFFDTLSNDINNAYPGFYSYDKEDDDSFTVNIHMNEDIAPEVIDEINYSIYQDYLNTDDGQPLTLFSDIDTTISVGSDLELSSIILQSDLTLYEDDKTTSSLNIHASLKTKDLDKTTIDMPDWNNVDYTDINIDQYQPLEDLPSDSSLQR